MAVYSKITSVNNLTQLEPLGLKHLGRKAGIPKEERI